MPDQGLINYYSAQADLLLTQYQNFNHLLGKTPHWTAPGTLCEVLLREAVRRSLPGRFSVDKGFIYGRDDASPDSTHSPEIDLLIHDSHDYQPIFRVEEFVVVEPDAARGAIQVKRTLTSCSLQKALQNVSKATAHLRKHRHVCSDEYFSAILAFEDGIGLREDGKVSGTYANQLAALSLDCLPDFIGTVTGTFLWHSGNEYEVVRSVQDGTNIALTALLSALSRKVLPVGKRPRFSFPVGVAVLDRIPLLREDQSAPPE